MQYSYLTILVLLLYAIQGTSNVENVIPILDSPQTESRKTAITMLGGLLNDFQNSNKDKSSTENNAFVAIESKNLNIGREMPYPKIKYKDIGRHHFRMGPVLNSLKHRRLWQAKLKGKESSSSSDTEMNFWIDDWKEKRLRQKFEALNTSDPRGDAVNMKKARPWGVECGDPNQYDMPWGNCMLPQECDGEYRIYRGDSFCGRSGFICCGLIQTSYDMYQGLDLSFAHEDSLSSDSDDIKKSREEKHRESLDRKRTLKKRKRNRIQMKKKIRRSIKRVILEITKLLHRAYRNQSAQQYKKSKELQKFIKAIKKQYVKDRKNLVDLHGMNMMTYDMKMEESLSKIHDMNYAFMNNDTFRDIVVNGTVNKEKLLRFQQSHPVLSLFFKNRRFGGGDLEKTEPEKKEEVPKKEEEVPESKKKKNSKLLEYDLEYGMLYY